jgi:hypothetical protein
MVEKLHPNGNRVRATDDGEIMDTNLNGRVIANVEQGQERAVENIVAHIGGPELEQMYCHVKWKQKLLSEDDWEPSAVMSEAKAREESLKACPHLGVT